MKANLFKIECLTDLHVGAGEANYNIIDNEVEKDHTGYPIVHASGIKGALRDYFKNKLYESLENDIFGKPGNDKEDSSSGTGKYKFLDAYILARPLRVYKGDSASIPVLSVAMVNHYLSLSNALRCNPHGITGINITDDAFQSKSFLVFSKTSDNMNIEGESTVEMNEDLKNKTRFLTDLLGNNFAIAREINDYDLPVLARNCLQEKRENLWYEEVVPHGSIFFMIILIPDDSNFELPLDNEIIQLGAHSSIGRGFCKVTRIEA